jgi:hypothetical protein
MTIDDRLHEALTALDEQVHSHVREHHLAAPGVARPVTSRDRVSNPMTRRHRQWVVPALGAVSVLLVVVGVIRGTHAAPAQQPSPARTTAPAPAPPSQSVADAARDHVLSAIAAMPLAERVHLTPPARTTQIRSPQGLWVLSNIDPAEPVDSQGRSSTRCLGPDTQPGRRYKICSPYGELLLLSADQQRILRAYPMPHPAEWLVAGPRGLYLGQQGDGGYPDTMVCRVAAGTLALTCRDYQAPNLADGPEYTAKELSAWPGHWVIDRHSVTNMDSAKIVGDALVIGGTHHEPSTRLSLTTLAQESG